MFRKLGERTILAWLLVAVMAASLGYAAIVLGGREGEPPAPSIVEQTDGRMLVRVHVALENDTRTARHDTITLAEPLDAVLRSTQVRWTVGDGERVTVPVVVEVPPGWFERGPRALYLRIDSENGTQRITRIAVNGPS